MSTQKALVIPEAQQAWVIRADWPIPKPGPNELLVKVIAAALNPADWRVRDYGSAWIKDYPFVNGLDGAGVIEELGPGVTGFVVGDKILFPGGFDNRHATFQQYNIVPAANAAKIPDNLTFEQAASVPLGLATVACGLWAHEPGADSVNFPAPWEEGGKTKFVGQAALIIGGASSVGQYAIQAAKIQGFSPILTTASLHNEAHLKSLGATCIIDRTLSFPDIAREIEKLTEGKPLSYVFDAITSAETQRFAYDVLAEGGALVLTQPLSREILADKIKEGDRKKVGRPFAGLSRPGNEKLGVELYKRLTEWLATGLIVPNRIEVLPNGLAGIPEGLERLKAGKVSGTKLIARPQETE